jgi:hypothetical protein
VFSSTFVARKRRRIVGKPNVGEWRILRRSVRTGWLSRYVIEGKAVSLLKAQLALSALAKLRAGEREAAAKMLTELVRR